MKKAKKQFKWTPIKSFYFIFIPIVAGILAQSVTSDETMIPNYPILWITIPIIAIWGLFNFFTNKYLEPKWTFKFLFVCGNLGTFFMVSIPWRVFGEKEWLGILFLSLYLICIYVGIKFKEKIVVFVIGSIWGYSFIALTCVVALFVGVTHVQQQRLLAIHGQEHMELRMAIYMILTGYYLTLLVSSLTVHIKKPTFLHDHWDEMNRQKKNKQN